MNEKEKCEFVKIGIDAMMEFRGAGIDRIKAVNYVDIDVKGEGILGIIFDRFFERFNVVRKDKGTVKWNE